jgi:hypothetical protein
MEGSTKEHIRMKSHIYLETTFGTIISVDNFVSFAGCPFLVILRPAEYFPSNRKAGAEVQKWDHRDSAIVKLEQGEQSVSIDITRVSMIEPKSSQVIFALADIFSLEAHIYACRRHGVYWYSRRGRKISSIVL